MSAPNIVSLRQVNETSLVEIAEACKIPKDSIEDVYACTPFQEGIFADSHTFSSSYTDRYVHAVEPSLDMELLCSAVDQVIQRNGVLRTRIVDCSLGLLQVVVKADSVMQRSSRSLAEYIQEDRMSTMGLGVPLLRSAILLEDRKWVLTVHHAIWDHRVSAAFLSDIGLICQGKPGAVHVHFKNFVKEVLALDKRRAKLFWKSQFHGTPVVFPRVDPGYTPKGNQTIRKEVSAPLERSSPALIPSYLQAALACTIQTYANSNNIVYGLVLSGRNSTTSHSDGLIMGPTITTVPIQVHIESTANVRSLLKDISQKRRDISTNAAQQYGLARIKHVSEEARLSSGFQTLLNIRSQSMDTAGPPGLTFEGQYDLHLPFALSLTVDINTDSITVEAAFDLKITPRCQVERMVDQFLHMVRVLLETSPETELRKLQRLNTRDRDDIITWNKAIAEPVEASLQDLISGVAQTWPDLIAVDAWDGRLTYRDLDARSTHLAYELRARGMQQQSAVCFVFEKSMLTVVAVLAILKAGGFCVPIDPGHPLERKKYIIEQAGVKFAMVSNVTAEAIAGLVPDVVVVSFASLQHLAETTLKSSPDQTAFVLFTSGSTGTPKGVVLTHTSLASALTTIGKRFGWDRAARTLQFAAHVWDVSILEMIGPLLFGGCTCIPSDEIRESGLADFINSYKVNFALQTTTSLRNLSPEAVPGLQMLVSAGEPVSPQAAKTWGARTKFINAWGPCECGILASYAELTPDSPYPESIGTPLGTGLWIVDHNDPSMLLPIGATGEIVVEGPVVAQGYLNDGAKSTSSFIEPPAWAPARNRNSTNKFYRSGDMARYNPDGSLCFLGRLDKQVKMRGQRFDITEIEKVLTSSGDVLNALVSTHASSQEQKELVAVIVLASPQLSNKTRLKEINCRQDAVAQDLLFELHDYARDRLPSYMIPTRWFAVLQLPQTASAKLDRVRIEEWVHDQDMSRGVIGLNSINHEKVTPPISAAEKTLQSTWSTVLGIPENEIGRETSFMQFGDSISAMRVATRCRKLGLGISMAALLQSKSLAEAAEQTKPVDTPNQLLRRQEASEPTMSTRKLDANLKYDLNRHERIEINGNGHPPTPGAGTSPGKANFSGHSTHVDPGDIEDITVATDLQAWMVAMGVLKGEGLQQSKFSFETSKDTLDGDRLQNAWQDVLRHQPILRTVFVQRGHELLQAVLPYASAASLKAVGGQSTSPDTNLPWIGTLPNFTLLYHEDKSCHGFSFTIDHALYDGISIGILLEDLQAAYDGHELASRPHFHEWISHVSTSHGLQASEEFWGEALRGSSMSYLTAAEGNSVDYDHPVDSTITFSIESEQCRASPGTFANTLKAAWAIVLGLALGTQDVVFAEFSANRYLPMTDIDQIAGPCLNLLPVRADFQGSTTMNSLIQQLQEQSRASTGFQTSLRSLTRGRSSRLPSWTRFGSLMVVENHQAFGSVLEFGTATCSVTARGKVGVSADIVIMAFPGSTKWDIELLYTSAKIPTSQAQWIADCLFQIFDSLPSALERNIDQQQAELLRTVGSYTIPNGAEACRLSSHSGSSMALPSQRARDAVSYAWKQVGILDTDSGLDHSIWEAGADIVLAMLLSEQYRQGGHTITTQDILQHPTQRMQGVLIDAQTAV